MSMQFNFNDVKAAEEGKPMTPPGTIAVFTIEEVKFNQANGKENFQVTFSRNEDSFREYFHLTEKAAERFVYLYNKVMGTETLPESEAGIIAALTGKSLALKVVGSINNQTGKGYPGLPYSGYARPAAEIADLSFSNTEQGKIQAVIEAQRNVAANPQQSADNVLGGSEIRNNDSF